MVLIAADAQILRADGDYRGAFECLLSLQRMAAHAAQDSNLSFSLPLMLEGQAVELIPRMLEVELPDEDVLSWLRNRLALDPLPSRWLLRLTRRDFAQTVHMLRQDRETLKHMRMIVPTMSTETYRARKEAWSDLGDDEVIDLMRQAYARFLDSVEETLLADMPYTEKRTALQSLVRELRRQERNDPAMIWNRHADDILDRYDILTRRRATLNMVRTAVEIYLVAARRGQLPECLGDGLPNDPYSDKAFDYAITPNGFVLRCRAMPGDSREIPELECGVPGKN